MSTLAFCGQTAYSKDKFDERKDTMAKIHRNDDPYAVQNQRREAAARTQQMRLPDREPQPPRAPVRPVPDAEPPHPVQGAEQPRQKKKPEPSRGKSDKKKGKSNLVYNIAMIVCLIVFLVSGGILVKRYFDDRQAESEFADLQALIDPEATGENGESNSARFAALRDRNSDFIGWISIQDTNLDFPVMYAPNNKDFYLRHDFNKEYSVYGVPYLDENTTLGANDQSENLIVYGHNMKTGTIFGCLTGYKDASYYTEHPDIEFDTVYGDGTYEVFAAFSIDVVADTSFVYNRYIDMDEAAYNEYVDEVISRSDVDTGIRPSYGEQLLTLSTCEYSSSNGRYVVVARRVDNE